MTGYVSIIVPVYNAQKTLKRCVDSLTSQSYDKLEIILVNDGSKDDSLQLCHELAEQDSRIRVIDKPNGGVSSARNAGLDAAQGEFVMFCDSDDWVEPEWCECMLVNYKDGDLPICDISREDFPELISVTIDMDTAERKHIFRFPMLMCALFNKIYSRNIIENNNLHFSEQLRLGEDFSFVLSYLCCIQGCLRFVRKKLYNYDVSTDGSLSKRAPEVEQCNLFYRLITASMEKLGATDAQSVSVRNRFVIGHYEKILVDLAENREYSIFDKLKMAEIIQNLESFRVSCDGIEWGNPLYQWFYHRGNAKMVVVFLTLRMKIKGR